MKMERPRIPARFSFRQALAAEGRCAALAVARPLRRD